MTERTPTAPPWVVAFASGGAGHTLGYDKGILTVLAEGAHPPGRPLELTLTRPETPGAPPGEATAQPAALALSARCIGSRRLADGGFQVRLRLINLTRHARLALEAHYG